MTRGCAAVAVLVAMLVAALRWPDPAVVLLALVTGVLAALAWRASRGSDANAEGSSVLPPRPVPSPVQPVPTPRSGHVPPSRPAQWPLAVATAPPAGATPALAPAATAAPQARIGLRVLVAEDHDINRRLLAELLANLGHEAHFAADGEAAVDAVRRAHFDVVLMDLSMPRLDGLAATRAIRALPDSRQATLPIVALTADELPQTRGRCLLAGMNDFLTKPIAVDALAVCLRRLYGDAVQQRPPGAASPPANAEPAVIDGATLNEVLASLPRERVSRLIEQFFEQAPAQLQVLHDAIRDAQTAALKVAAHGLRGAALNLGMTAVAGTAGALHDGAAQLAAHEVALLLQRLERQLLQSRTALKAMGL